MAGLLAMLGGRNLAQSEPGEPPAVNKETSVVRLTMTEWTEEAPGCREKLVVEIRHVDCNDRTANDTLQIEVLPSFETEKKE